MLNPIARVEGEEAHTRAANKVLRLVSMILEEDGCDGTELAAAGENNENNNKNECNIVM